MKSSDVRIYNFGDYSSNNYGSSRALQFGNLTLYFSYETIIAFRSNHGLCIRKNDWSTTTGKHLNSIDPNHKIRISGEQFEKELDDVLAGYELKELVTQ